MKAFNTEIIFEKIEPPKEGKKIDVIKGVLKVPDYPIIPVITGDGIGPDIIKTAKKVLDAAVEKAYGSKRRIIWFHVPAGEESFNKFGEHLPLDTIKAIKHYVVAIKGPLTTPVGRGIRSLNVTIRQNLNLFACVRPIKWIRGVPSPIRHPEKVDLVIFRENTEDVYAGIEWKQGSKEARKVWKFLIQDMKVSVNEDSGIGVKIISIRATKRLVRAAIKYAISKNMKTVTLMHKGNIMKFTEGAFREWGYEVAKEEFGDKVISEEEVYEKHRGHVPEGKVLIKDRIADSMFQQVLLRPSEYDVIATPNLNGDYISDACAALVGGLGVAPGSNINYETSIALFEPTHGSVPKYANLDKVNPTSIILSGVLMLDYIGWKESADLIVKGLEETIQQRTVTYDLERNMEKAKLLKCSEFGNAIIEKIK